MRATVTKGILVLAVALTMSACGKNNFRVEPQDTGPGPDEFGIVPNKPLVAPASYAELPAPTPGAGNLADPNPNGAAIAALGGRGTATASGADGALIAYVSRNGVDPAIRSDLSGGSSIGSGFFGLFGRVTGNRSTLDPYAEALRLQALGIKTPSAPPN